jgi:hypothetical protein
LMADGFCIASHDRSLVHVPWELLHALIKFARLENFARLWVPSNLGFFFSFLF